MPGQSVGLARKALLIHRHPWKGGCYPGNYFKFISAVKCNCAHTADVSVLGELSSAQEAVENVVLVALTSAAVLLGGSRKGPPQTGKGHFIIFKIHIFLTEAALHRGKMCPLGCGVGLKEGCTNGRGLAGLTPHTLWGWLQSRVRPNDVSSGMAEPFQASWGTMLASECPWHLATTDPCQIQSQLLSLVLKLLQKSQWEIALKWDNT